MRTPYKRFFEDVALTPRETDIIENEEPAQPIEIEVTPQETVGDEVVPGEITEPTEFELEPEHDLDNDGLDDMEEVEGVYAQAYEQFEPEIRDYVGSLSAEISNWLNEFLASNPHIQEQHMDQLKSVLEEKAHGESDRVKQILACVMLCSLE